MSTVQAAGAIYRLPPFTVGPSILMAHQLEDKVDWGLRIHKIPEHWLSAGEGIVVGVADTGRPLHMDLEGAIIAGKNFSTSYTDEDTAGHATHVCGTIGARKNGRGVVGIAHACKIVTAKVLGDDGSGDTVDVVKGLDWLAEQGCHIINMSLGGPFDSHIAETVKRLVDAGIFVICAVGNEGNYTGRNTVNYPARLPYTVAVTSYNEAGEISSFSSRGDMIDIALPGENILSCWRHNTYRRLSGTSMAAPFASGLVALLLAASKDWPEEKKLKNNYGLQELIKQVTIDKGEIGRDRDWGWGVLDVNRFVKATAMPVDVEIAAAMELVTPPGWCWETITHEGRTGLFITSE